jgi:flagellin-specific chaperone FliS
MAMMENGWGKERKINSGSAISNQLRDAWKELKQKCSQTESAIKNF